MPTNKPEPLAKHPMNERRIAEFALAVVDPATHRLTVVNAGHPPPLLRRADGTVQAIGETLRGMPLTVGSRSGRSRRWSVSAMSRSRS